MFLCVIQIRAGKKNLWFPQKDLANRNVLTGKSITVKKKTTTLFMQILLSTLEQQIPQGCSSCGAQWPTEREESAGEWVFWRLKAFILTEPARIHWLWPLMDFPFSAVFSQPTTQMVENHPKKVSFVSLKSVVIVVTGLTRLMWSFA